MLSMTLWLLSVLVPLQILIGDQHGLNTLRASAGQARRDRGALGDRRAACRSSCSPFPTRRPRPTASRSTIPYLGSLILTHSLDGDGEGPEGLSRPTSGRRWRFPSSPSASWSASACSCSAWSSASWWLRWRGRLFDSPLFLRACMFVGPLGFIAVLAGWTTTEVGRQPWTVYGLMRTADAVSPSLTGCDVLLSLIGYIVVYLIIFPAGVAGHGPHRPQGAGRRRSRARRPGRGRPAEQADHRRAACQGRGMMDERPQLRTDLDGRSSPSASSSTCCSTASISASASSTASSRTLAVAQPRHELDRADLGRQRNLAGARRHRAARGLSARLRHHHPGALFPDAAHAACAGVPRRRLRVPLPRCRAQDASGTTASATARRSPPSRRA